MFFFFLLLLVMSGFLTFTTIQHRSNRNPVSVSVAASTGTPPHDLMGYTVRLLTRVVVVGGGGGGEEEEDISISPCNSAVQYSEEYDYF